MPQHLPPPAQPYSRLMALKTMGVVKNYERIRDFSVAVVGIGGIGVGVVEMLTRCGIGKIIIYDYDTIDVANMNRMFYRPEQAGWNKTMACRHYCSELNPDTSFEVHNINIAVDENKAKFKVRRVWLPEARARPSSHLRPRRRQWPVVRSTARRQSTSSSAASTTTRRARRWRLSARSSRSRLWTRSFPTTQCRARFS